MQSSRRLFSLRITQSIFLLGVSAYAKSGNADTKDFHARLIAGGIFFNGHGVFAFIINWYAASPDDPEPLAYSSQPSTNR